MLLLPELQMSLPVVRNLARCSARPIIPSILLILSLDNPENIDVTSVDSVNKQVSFVSNSTRFETKL